jgi:hypothetical protein
MADGTIYNWTGTDGNSVDVAKYYTRYGQKKVLVEFKNIPYRTAHKLNELLDSIYEDGRRAGKAEVLAVIERAVVNIRE